MLRMNFEIEKRPCKRTTGHYVLGTQVVVVEHKLFIIVTAQTSIGNDKWGHGECQRIKNSCLKRQV